MEDIEYLEEYEDFILPKTLNYSEEFPVNTTEGDLLDETCNDLNPELPLDGPECEDNISRSHMQNSRTNKANLVKIINSEVLRTPAQVQHYNKDATPTASNIPVMQETQTLQFKYDRPHPSFLDRITQNPVLQRLGKYKSVATVKPTLQRAKPFNLSSISPPLASTDSKIQKISSSECPPKTDVNVFNKVIEDDSFLDYAVEKHGADDFNLSFNLETVEMSDICSDSMNFSDDYNDDMFRLDSILSPEDKAKLKLKRQNNHDTDFEVNHKKSKYGSNFNSSKQMQKGSKQSVAEIFSRKSSINRKQHKTTPISVEKRKINSSGKQSKLVVKKNGKKFVFPDRSKFSLKNLSASNNVKDETQGTFTTKGVDVAAQIKINNNGGETNNDLISYSSTNKNNPQKAPIEKQQNIKSFFSPETTVNKIKHVDQEKMKDEDKVIFSSPKNMKRIDSEALIHQNPAIPNISTGITFGHFTLKSIKPPSNLGIKEILPKHSVQPHSGDKIENKLEDKMSKTYIELDKCLSPTEHNESASNANSKGKALENVLDSSAEKTKKTSNNKKEYTNTENAANALDLKEKSIQILSKEHSFIKGSTTIKKVIDKICSLDKSLKNFSKENDSLSISFPTKETFLETESNDLGSSFKKSESSSEKTVKIMSTNIIENWNSNKVNETDCSTERSLGDFYNENFSLTEKVHNKDELLQMPENISDVSISRDVSSMSIEKAVKSLNKKNENKHVKQIIDANLLTTESFENFCKDKYLVKASLPTSRPEAETVNNKMPKLTPIFEPRSFDIRLSKSIVANLLKSSKTQTNSNVPNQYDETKNLTNPGILPENNILDSTSVCASLKNSQRFATEPAETPGTKSKGKRGKKKKTIQPIVSVDSSIKSLPLMADSSENIIANLPCPPDGIGSENEKRNVQNSPSGLAKERISLPQTPNLAKGDSNRFPPYDASSDDKETRVQKLPCILANKPNILAVSTSVESESIDQGQNTPEENSPLRKNTRQTLKSKENSQPKANEIPVNLKEKKNSSRKEVMSTPVTLSDNCISYQTPVQQKSTKNVCDIEILEPKKELNDQMVVQQFKPTNLLTNDSLINKIKLNASPDTTYKSKTDLNVRTSSINVFGNEQINPKFTIFELPAYIVMKTKIITREDLEINKTIIPPVIKQQVDTDSENLTTESVIKTERFDFNSVCAQINSLLEQNANYLKFASGSERLTRMNDVLGDYSLSVEDANCTLKFLQSYLSSGPKDKAIKTRGQQFIPIYDSQKKIIGYRKRTIHVKALSSRRNSRRTGKIKAHCPASVTPMNVIRNSQIIAYDVELPPKLEPNLLDVGESELIVPDPSLANEICIKNEDNNIQ